MAKHIDIIYEDDDIVLLNKEAGMLTVADRFNQESYHLQSALKRMYGDIWTIHRLDKDTSGVICFAKNSESHQILSTNFEQRDIEKFYFAIVEGSAPESGEIDEPLAMSETKPGTMRVHRRGKESLTHFKKIDDLGLFSTLDVQIFTGRQHQIRVHLKHIGLPLFIDPLYGRRESFLLSELKGKNYKLTKKEEERPLISRLTLHSSKLIFDHPKTGKKMTIEAPVPKDMRALINQARKS
jgi:23S rRNA pseudouridine1911/1915/1917 synthase